MDDGSEQAMVETALALAMAFFALMVLALVSMQVDERDRESRSADPGLALARATPEAPGAPGAKAGPAGDRTLVVHYAGRFFDGDLMPVDPATIAGALTLALDPSLPTADALALRARLRDRDVLVTTLDRRWLNRLQEMSS